MASAPDRDDACAADRSADAYLHFESIRWPDGVVTCPHCGTAGRCRYLPPSDGAGRRTRTGQVSARRLWRCNACRRQFSVLTGTIFEGTRVPLSSWLDALAAAGRGPTGANAVAELTGVRLETARAMVGLIDAGLAASESAGQRQG